MRWKVKETPEIGARRVRAVFAWRPIKSPDGYWYWLERVRLVEQFCARVPSYPPMWGRLHVMPTNERWGRNGE